MRFFSKTIATSILFLLITTQLFAHPISITWAEVKVGADKIEVRLRVLAEDLFLFHQLEADNEDFISLAQCQKATEEHKPFLLKHFYLHDGKGRKLQAKITKVEPLEAPAKGINVADLMEYSLYYHIEFACPSRPESLQFTQHFGGKESVINAIMMLEISQEGLGDLPPSEVRKEKPTIIDLDWNRAPETVDGRRQRFEAMKAKKEKENLGISSYSSIYSFIYIEDFEVRHEVLVPIAMAESWFPIERKNAEELTVAEQEVARKQFEDFFSKQNPVEIDGKQVKPKVERIDFFGLDFKDFAKQAEPKPLDVAHARAGIILSYPAKGAPQQVKMNWDSFNKNIRTLKSVVYAYEDNSQAKFTRLSPSFKWENTGQSSVEEVKALRSEENEAWYSFFVDDEVDEEEADKISEALLGNIYKAFKYQTESEIYDALALSVEGDLLSKIYLDFKKNLVMQEQGGAISKVKSVEVVSGNKQDLTNEDENTFGYLCTWKVSGTVEHWGHIHERENEYMALFSIKDIDGAWKVVELKPLNQKRLKFKTSVREMF
ncbi:hypothetical protein R9C00_13125 [Flammeovirgaceae bacterium SG7u.111]|nr:hypothetical protein [Flammeovirgaceae bacterium SG7u.132]WPO38398.1 hypothetical protein R9C00_13125 [Flammeovirgaceae bacterium SG7u.111]